jgi:hypothetical protein
MKYSSYFLTLLILTGLCFTESGWAAKKSSKEIDALLQDEQRELRLLKKKIARQNKIISSTK